MQSKVSHSHWFCWFLVNCVWTGEIQEDSAAAKTSLNIFYTFDVGLSLLLGIWPILKWTDKDEGGMNLITKVQTRNLHPQNQDQLEWVTDLKSAAADQCCPLLLSWRQFSLKTSVRCWSVAEKSSCSFFRTNRNVMFSSQNAAFFFFETEGIHQPVGFWWTGSDRSTVAGVQRRWARCPGNLLWVSDFIKCNKTLSGFH